MPDKSKLPVRRGFPFLTPSSFFDEFRAEMEKFWRRPFFTWGEEEVGGEWFPRVDVFRKGEELIVKADLPGMKKKDVEVMVENGNLVLKGERRSESEIREEDFFRAERSFGSFYRRMALPEGVDAGKISAKFTDGVLEVHVPMPSEKAPKPQRIEVN